ncbi:10169_t:CDS:2 [Ambispora gerdemannii]|uniref:10169_t:CDS:1 n=1 Tax=Ambispora gerdemannii TaxID=144530 RepID=A0A9N8VUV1_9GLOM|nr:10169_t:CDS:2 [Ambispora gerdemannii]
MYPGQQYNQQKQNQGYPGSQQQAYQQPPPPTSYGGFAPPPSQPSPGGFISPTGPPLPFYGAPPQGGYPPIGNYGPGGFAPPGGGVPPVGNSGGFAPPGGGIPPVGTSGGFAPPVGGVPPVGNSGGFVPPGGNSRSPYPGQQGQQYAPPAYQQPPNSIHNAGPHPVPYGQPPSNQPVPDGFTVHHNPHASQAAPNFQLSNCTGRKRALLIGINYFGTKAELRGCLNDVKNIKNFIMEYYNFREQDMVILTDDKKDPKMIPTRANIIAAMRWLVKGAQPNDSFFLHYSGHGGRAKDLNGDEDDGYDETICPVDFQTAGQLVDDEMHDILVKPLPAGVRLTAIFDSCHSGTALDLPYIYSTKGVIKEPNLLAEGGSVLLNAGMSYLRRDYKGIADSLKSFGKKAMSGNKINEKNKQQKSSQADVLMFSGCKDIQTSADAHEGGENTGAMSYAFISSLRKNQKVSYQQLLSMIRDILASKYSQKPQLSASHPMDMNLMFMM